MLSKIVQDVTGVKPSLGLIGVVMNSPYIWAKILPSFLLGMVAYAYRDTLPRSWALLIGLSAAAVISCQVNQSIADMLVAPALAYGVLYIAFLERLKVHDAAKFGDFSYGTYLYAFPIQQMLQATTRLSLPGFMALSAVLALLAGVVSWHLVEKGFVLGKTRGGDLTPRLSSGAIGNVLLQGAESPNAAPGGAIPALRLPDGAATKQSRR
jgi:peptidoglycan/LPS O-acetylase OafA/YrhL